MRISVMKIAVLRCRNLGSQQRELLCGENSIW